MKSKNIQWLPKSQVKINGTIHDASPIMFIYEMSKAAEEEGKRRQDG